MHLELLNILRCPFCGGSLGLVDTGLVNRRNDDILDGILGCHCCAFPIVDGIPVMHVEEAAAAARSHLDAGRGDLARRAMFGFGERGGEAERFDALAASPAATYRDIVDALGPRFEGGYFLYRFTDPTYLVAHALARAVASTVLGDGGRAVDLCGGSGHLTRALLDLSSPPPVLADLHYSKVWLARRFTAPNCEGLCCDGNAPLPFERGAFRFAVCSDAYHYIWTKRLFASEMLRLVETADGAGAAVVTHTHNANRWNPSAGMALPPDAYRALFHDPPARLYSDAALLADIVGGGRVDLSRSDSDAVLDEAPALTLIVSRHPGVFATHPLDLPTRAAGEFRINPLYAAVPGPESGLAGEGERVELTLRFPSQDYADEYDACRLYLPARVTADRAALAGLPARTVPAPLTDLARQRVVIDLPERYY